MTTIQGLENNNMTVGERLRRERNPETRIQRWKRLWHLHRRDVWSWVFAVAGVALVIVFVGAAKSAYRNLALQVETSHWWNRIPPAARNRIGGSFLGVAGLALLRRRWKLREGISSFWELRMFVAEAAMLIGGVVLVVKGIF